MTLTIGTQDAVRTGTCPWCGQGWASRSSWLQVRACTGCGHHADVPKDACRCAPCVAAILAQDAARRLAWGQEMSTVRDAPKAKRPRGRPRKYPKVEK